VFILTHSILLAQISDDFSDGDFSTNPTWGGITADYTVNGSFEVQLNSSVASTSYLSTPHGLSTLDTKEWRIWTRQSFSPSSGNFGRIYLTASNADLSTAPDGFYLQLGEAGSNDAVRLFKSDGGLDTELITGTLGQIATSFSIGIRVVRDNLGNWSLYIDDAGGQNYALAGTANDATNLLGTHFGFIDVYTVSNSTGFYYDDVYVGDEIVDVVPPVLTSVTTINANLIDVLFDEAVDQTIAENTANYDIQPFLSASTATLDGVNPALVHIVPSASLTNGSAYTLFTNNIEDISGNASGSQSMNFSYLIAESPVPGDVIINEFMCDPEPQVGLPIVEFVELHNVSSKIFNLEDWKLADAASAGTIQQGWLLPGEYMIVASTSNVDSFAVATAVTSFPSLNNSGDNIVLRDTSGIIIDSISYTDDWYADPTKDGGGYTIERINPDAPCSSQSNWAASVDNLGGTPGLINSIFDNTPDISAPDIEQLIALAPNYLEIYFTEGMDSTSLADAVISTNPTLTIQNNYVFGAYPSMMTLQFVENLTSSQNYTIELQNVADCWLNSTTVNGLFALPENGTGGDVVINEIMFNPLTGGSDWVEVYNNSSKLIDLFNWEIANYDNDTIDNNKVVGEHFLLYPEEYAVLAEDTLHIVQNYPSYEGGRFIQMDLPTYSNDSGSVYIIYLNQVIDKVSYSDDWHFQLLDDVKGKSLERIEPDGISSDGNNWHTAAEAIGFATPGMENSQYYPSISNGEFSFTSETISPDSDGFEDVLQVNYEMTQPGLVADFTIYDDRGRKIATVLESELLATSGTFIWDGTRDDNTKASIGAYVGIFEAFDPNGGVVFTKRKAFVVAGRL
jgi:hypothetical protein